MKKNPFFLVAAVAGLIWYFFFNKKTPSPTLQPLPTGGVKTISAAYVPKIQTANMIASPIGLLDLNNAGGTDRLGNLAPASDSGSKSCGCGC